MSKVENTELLKLIDEFIEIDEQENKDMDKLAEIGHQLDHTVLECELIAIVNNEDREFNEILRLIVEDENDSYFIPAYTDVEEAKKGIEALGLNEDQWTYEFEAMTGLDILDIGIEDEKFVGIVINPYDTDFIFPKEDIINAAICNQEHESCD
ncbi:MAG: SseB family protein [Methanobrevibacter sp.]|uniref:SseB family protein n=1 Tax=Methanobrevibacter sp. TaxID=66852 RepID=UPI0026E09775|nr:SseB family protein [Methanobrevibacter sp.]MDO5849478.1 SseB family protein [Methanobrevibacter sp.]